MFTNTFNSYACENDSISCNIGKYTFTATIVHDSDSNPNDFECYSKDDISRWKMMNGFMLVSFCRASTIIFPFRVPNPFGD